MKSKYILPVIATASLTTIVTPLVSCGNDSLSAEWKWNGQSWHKFVPSIPAREDAIEYDTFDDALNAYHDCIKTRPKIFSEDYVCYIANQNKPDSTNVEKGIVTHIKVTAKNIGDVEHYIDPWITERSDIIRFSFDMVISSDIEMTWTRPSIMANLDFVKRKINIRNFPMRLYQNNHEDLEFEQLHKTVQEYKDDNKWSVNMPEMKEDITENDTSLITFKDNNITYDSENYPPEGGVLPDVFVWICEKFVRFKSEYFKNSSIKDIN